MPRANASVSTSERPGERNRDLQIHVPLGETYPECQLQGIRWYSNLETPIVGARCAIASDPQCLWLMPGNEGLVAQAVGKDRPLRECSASPRRKASVRVERFEALH